MRKIVTGGELVLMEGVKGKETMNLDANPREQLQGTHRWAVALVVVVVLYVLSPFPVFLAVSRGYGGLDNADEQTDFLLDVVYRPLVMAAMEWDPVEKFYLDGFDLIGVR
jgi:hypothetical protein